MNFTKMQGAGNDFVLMETNDMHYDWSRLAIAMCDRHFGIGGDGLLLVTPLGKADFRMRVFNPDGSEAEACGNGLRCLARYALEKGLLKAGVRQMVVETVSGMRKVNLYKIADKVTKIQVCMDEPRFRAEDIPVIVGQSSDLFDIKPILNCPVTIEDRKLSLDFVRVGNPHTIYFWQHPVSDFPLSQIGPNVENHKMFPKRTNFEVARVISRRQIEVRVWERGVGETLACGSGACAVAVAAQLYGYIDNKVDIIFPGGTLQVEWNGSGEVLLSGPAEKVFSGEWPNEV